VSRRRAAWGLLAALVLACAATGGLYVYQRSHNVIAEGVTIGGVDVGGLSPAAAKQKLRAVLAPRLQRPVVVQSLRSRFALRRVTLGVRPEIELMVGEAVELSRAGNFLRRAWRDLAGGRLEREIPLRVSYSPSAVERIVDGVERSIDRRPHNARLRVTPGSLRVFPGRAGIAVRTPLLRRELASALTDLGSSPVVRVPTRVVRPRVTIERLAERDQILITVDRKHKRLRLWRKLKLAKTYVIAVGRIGLETPAGFYRVRSKAADPAWYVPRSPWAGSLAGKVIPGGYPQNPIKARWLGFHAGAGVHGTDDLGSLGSAASHGCIRMSIPDVIQLYKLVPLGARIYIA
jgi:lipoprotein-anchoring transpeptidase ErfK/SrfK